MLGKRDRANEMSPSALKRVAQQQVATTSTAADRPVARIANPTESLDAACPICRSLLIQKCINCVSGLGTTSGGCHITAGTCGCCFHTHCLVPWIMRREICPVHDCAWESCAPSLDILQRLSGRGPSPP